MLCILPLKGIVHPKIIIFLRIYYPSCHTKRVCLAFFCIEEDIWKMSLRFSPCCESRWCLLLFWTPLTFSVWTKAVETSSKYPLLSYIEERKPYGFGTTWGGNIDDSIFIFRLIIPLIPFKSVQVGQSGHWDKCLLKYKKGFMFT